MLPGIVSARISFTASGSSSRAATSSASTSDSGVGSSPSTGTMIVGEMERTPSPEQVTTAEQMSPLDSWPAAAMAFWQNPLAMFCSWPATVEHGAPPGRRTGIGVDSTTGDTSGLNGGGGGGGGKGGTGVGEYWRRERPEFAASNSNKKTVSVTIF